MAVNGLVKNQVIEIKVEVRKPECAINCFSCRLHGTKVENPPPSGTDEMRLD